MTVNKYNNDFYPKYQKAVSFVSCIDNAIRKSGEEAKRQMSIIGWDEETKNLILEALELYNKETRSDVHFYGVSEEEAEVIEAIKCQCTHLCSGGVMCLTCKAPQVKDLKEFEQCLDL